VYLFDLRVGSNAAWTPICITNWRRRENALTYIENVVIDLRTQRVYWARLMAIAGSDAGIFFLADSATRHSLISFYCHIHALIR